MVVNSEGITPKTENDRSNVDMQQSQGKERGERGRQREKDGWGGGGEERVGRKKLVVVVVVFAEGMEKRRL